MLFSYRFLSELGSRMPVSNTNFENFRMRPKPRDRPTALRRRNTIMISLVWLVEHTGTYAICSSVPPDLRVNAFRKQIQEKKRRVSQRTSQRDGNQRIKYVTPIMVPVWWALDILKVFQVISKFFGVLMNDFLNCFKNVAKTRV